MAVMSDDIDFISNSFIYLIIIHSSCFGSTILSAMILIATVILHQDIILWSQLLFINLAWASAPRSTQSHHRVCINMMIVHHSLLMQTRFLFLLQVIATPQSQGSTDRGRPMINDDSDVFKPAPATKQRTSSQSVKECANELTKKKDVGISHHI